jgi:hypothetical protein
MYLLLDCPQGCGVTCTTRIGLQAHQFFPGGSFFDRTAGQLFCQAQ